ncbi:FAD-binding oxidoreductase [Spirosoma sp. KNUC1025]|uniref:FAD-binding oxidoreductase n=1 Tax=Spirosoma sp. KNUC1025 TaxID=2894082 RepID=UPI003866B5A2|nr:FAD-binding oxidoreductase [Spirosoma sp. KNUC1025]
MKTYPFAVPGLTLGLLLSLLHWQNTLAATDAIPKPIPRLVERITPNTYKGRQIAVGSGGGFTGAWSMYYLFDNGRLFGRHSRDTTFTFIGQQSTARTKRLFNSAEITCKIKKTKFDHPGNRYKFVQWRKGKLSYKVSWGHWAKKCPLRIQSFMTRLWPSFRLSHN